MGGTHPVIMPPKVLNLTFVLLVVYPAVNPISAAVHRSRCSRGPMKSHPQHVFCCVATILGRRCGIL